jgi:Dual specificity phosphatase, catalytic domain
MRLSLAFGLMGLALAALATSQTGWVFAVAEGYLAACFLTLAIIYGLRALGFGVEDAVSRPAWSWLVRAILLPYRSIGIVVLFISRWFDREGLLNPLADRIYVGRLPFPFERAEIQAAGIDAVLNLCWEFPRFSGLDREPGMIYAHLPILDGSPPTDRQFREAVETVERWRSEGRCVLIHCAQGHGRTATISAAVLVRLGLAAEVEQALAMVKAARPLARPSVSQRAALIRFTLDPRTASSLP